MTALGKGLMINSVNESLGQYVRSIYYKEPIAKNWEISFLHKKKKLHQKLVLGTLQKYDRTEKIALSIRFKFAITELPACDYSSMQKTKNKI